MEHLSQKDIQNEFNPQKMIEKETVCFKIVNAAAGVTATSTLEFHEDMMCFANFKATSQLVNFVYRKNTLKEVPSDPYGVYMTLKEEGMPLGELNSNQQRKIKRRRIVKNITECLLGDHASKDGYL